MTLSRVQMEVVMSALNHREVGIRRLLENSLLDTIDPNWKPQLREELSQIPQLKEIVLSAMYPSIVAVAK